MSSLTYRRGRPAQLWRVIPTPTAAFHPDTGIWFSTLLPTVFLINSGLVTTVSALSRQTGVGL